MSPYLSYLCNVVDPIISYHIISYLTLSVSKVILSLSVVLQTCNASVSRSSDHGTHISDSGPYPSHHSSLPLSVMMGPSRSSLREGKCVSSFSICGLR
jgi:hypothetical protein